MKRPLGLQLPSVTPSMPRCVRVVIIFISVREGLNDLYPELPFGFNLSISQIQNDFNITTNGSTVAGLATVSYSFCLDSHYFHWSHFTRRAAHWSLSVGYSNSQC